MWPVFAATTPEGFYQFPMELVQQPPAIVACAPPDPRQGTTSSSTRIVFVAPPGVAGSRAQGCVYDAYTLWLKLHEGQDPPAPFDPFFDNWSSLNDATITNDRVVPFDSLEAGYAALRAGEADRMYILRGYDYLGPITPCGQSFGKSGKDEFRPMIVGAYGSPSWERPRVVRPSVLLSIYPRVGCTGGYEANMLRLQNSDGQSNLVFESLDFDAPYRDAEQYLIPEDAKENTPPAIAVYAGARTRNLLFQDVRIRHFTAGLTVESGSFCDHPVDITLFRCVLKDNFPGRGGRASGLFTSNTIGLVVNECVIDRNGWNPNLPLDLYPWVNGTVFNQNAYISQSCTATTFTRNITSRASHAGLQLRGGYDNLIDDNLSLDNPHGLTIGHRENNYPCNLPILCGIPPSLPSGGPLPGPDGTSPDSPIGCGPVLLPFETCSHSFSLTNNVVLGSDNVSKSAPRGLGISVARMHSGIVSGNIVAHGDTPLARRLSTTPTPRVPGGLDRIGMSFDWACRDALNAKPKCDLPACGFDNQGVIQVQGNIVFHWNSIYDGAPTGVALKLGGSRSTDEPRARGLLPLPPGLWITGNSFDEPCGAPIVHYFGNQPFSEVSPFSFYQNRIFNWAQPDDIALRTTDDAGPGRPNNQPVGIGTMLQELTAVATRYESDNFRDPMRNIESRPRNEATCWYTNSTSYMGTLKRREPARYPYMPVLGENARNEFIERAAENRKGIWDENFTSARFNEFFRLGFQPQ